MKQFSHLGIVLCLLSGTGVVFGDSGDRAPEALVKEYPTAPFKMRFGNDGTATALFKVNPDGNVENVRMLATSKPDVEAPVVAALLKWRFSPALKEGLPVSAYLEQGFRINILEGNTSLHFNSAPWGIPPKASANAPREFQYDQAPVPILTVTAVYPRELLAQNIEGWATIAFAIDPSGRPRQFAVAGASRPEFGPPAVAMIAAWRFSSPGRDGEACWAAIKMKQLFEVNDEDVATDDNTERILRALKKTPCPIVRSPAELDAVPTPRYQPPPDVPEETVKAGAPARAVIEIVIDRDGRAQIPRVVSATRDDFGWAAATAVARWQFTVPTKNGDPVDVFAAIPFEYIPPGTENGSHRADSRIKLQAADGKWSNYGPYLRQLLDTVQIEWDRILHASDVAHTRGNSVSVRFLLNSKGAVSRILAVNSASGTPYTAAVACVAAIKARSPYGAWPEGMIAVLGKEQALTFTFNYQ